MSKMAVLSGFLLKSGGISRLSFGRYFTWMELCVAVIILLAAGALYYVTRLPLVVK